MSAAAADIDALSTDLIHHILDLLPLQSLLRSTSVCKLWRSLILSSAATGSTWFFLLGAHNTSSCNHQSFAFDPVSIAWHLLPSPPASPSSRLPSPLLHHHPSRLLLYSLPPPRPFLPPPSPFPRINPRRSFIVVGGVKFISNLVDIEDNRLPVEIFNPGSNSCTTPSPLNSTPPTPPSPSPPPSSVAGSTSSASPTTSSLPSTSIPSAGPRRPSLSPRAPVRFLVSCSEKLLLAGLSNAGVERRDSCGLWSCQGNCWNG